MYGKVFDSLWQGSMVGQAAPQLVFLFLIANSDPDGFADFHPTTIAALTGLPPADVKAALLYLEAPDPESRSRALDGARLERIDAHREWGWRIVNYAHYRSLRDPDERRAQNRTAQAVHRQQQSATVSHGQPPSPQAEAEAEAEKDLEHLSAGADVFDLKSPMSGKVKGKAPRLPAETPAFVEFYEHVWPRRVKRDAAWRAWLSRIREGVSETLLIERAVIHAKIITGQGTAPKYIDHPSTFLNSGAWKDFPPEYDPEEAAS